MENNEHLSIDGLLKASQTLLNLKNSLPSDSLGIIHTDKTALVIQEIEGASIVIASELNKIYSAK